MALRIVCVVVEVTGLFMKFFIDSAEPREIGELIPTGLIDGVTTNPSLMAKTGRSINTILGEICALVEGPVSAEVTSTDPDGMLQEGRHLAKIAPNIVTKVPLTWAELQVCNTLRD